MKVLIIEDQYLLSMMLEDFIECFGHTSVGPATTPSEAVEFANRDDFDCALVDHNLIGGTSREAVQVLVDRQKPFAYMSGGGIDDTADEHVSGRIIRKPFTMTDIEKVLRDFEGSIAK